MRSDEEPTSALFRSENSIDAGIPSAGSTFRSACLRPPCRLPTIPRRPSVRVAANLVRHRRVSSAYPRRASHPKSCHPHRPDSPHQGSTSDLALTRPRLSTKRPLLAPNSNRVSTACVARSPKVRIHNQPTTCKPSAATTCTSASPSSTQTETDPASITPAGT